MKGYPFHLKSGLFVLLMIVGFARFAEPAEAQVQTPALIDRFTGEWEGKGTLMGADAEFKMTWERVLQGKFVRLTFQNKMRGSDGVDRVLNAQAFYKPEASGQFSGTWFDSRGMVLPLKANAEGDTLTTHWGSADTEQGRTIYRLVDQNKFEVEDFVLRGGEWRRFGSAAYQRTGE
jgi:hypothetical protein